MSDKLKIFYTNCDCLTKSKLNELEVKLGQMKPDIICLTEVLPKNKLLNYNQDMYGLNGYRLIESVLVKRGICLYAKINIKHKVKEDMSEFNEYIICELYKQL